MYFIVVCSLLLDALSSFCGDVLTNVDKIFQNIVAPCVSGAVSG